MKKFLHIAAKIIFSLILILPIAGATGALGEPTRELYETDLAFSFISALMEVQYINWMMSVVHVLALAALWTNREPLAALLTLPISLNVVAFHAVIDGGLFTGGALLGNIMLAVNLYLLWVHRERLSFLLKKH